MKTKHDRCQGFLDQQERKHSRLWHRTQSREEGQVQ
uniref:Uncharacterized protein n=1 Tax=Anguilla anguilla TaxID=7936 RepID=A0A0E9VK21_ANGAN